jgi:hypothetical protein
MYPILWFNKHHNHEYLHTVLLDIYLRRVRERRTIVLNSYGCGGGRRGEEDGKGGGGGNWGGGGEREGRGVEKGGFGMFEVSIEVNPHKFFTTVQRKSICCCRTII